MKRVRLYRHAPLRPVPPSTCAKVCALLAESLDLLGRGVLVCTLLVVLFLALLATLPAAEPNLPHKASGMTAGSSADSANTPRSVAEGGERPGNAEAPAGGETQKTCGSAGEGGCHEVAPSPGRDETRAHFSPRAHAPAPASGRVLACPSCSDEHRAGSARGRTADLLSCRGQMPVGVLNQ